jgi:hypothetical protein
MDLLLLGEPMELVEELKSQRLVQTLNAKPMMINEHLHWTIATHVVTLVAATLPAVQREVCVCVSGDICDDQTLGKDRNPIAPKLTENRIKEF